MRIGDVDITPQTCQNVPASQLWCSKWDRTEWRKASNHFVDVWLLRCRSAVWSLPLILAVVLTTFSLLSQPFTSSFHHLMVGLAHFTRKRLLVCFGPVFDLHPLGLANFTGMLKKDHQLIVHAIVTFIFASRTSGRSQICLMDYGENNGGGDSGTSDSFWWNIPKLIRANRWRWKRFSFFRHT